MSAIKRHLEDEIERLAEESGYSWSFLMDKWNELQEAGNANWMDFYDMAVEGRF